MAVYLRRRPAGATVTYVLRESIRVEDHWSHRDLFDLGSDPADFIEFPGGNGFYFKPELLQALADHGVSWSNEELEQVFLPFLPEPIRRVIAAFGGGAGLRQPKPDRQQLREQLAQTHPFDRRRLHYLRCGRLDMGRLDGRVLVLFKVLLDKGRDEIENLIEGMEAILRPHEIRPYIYGALDLESYFPHHLLRHHPAGLDPEKVDGCFLDAVCTLNRDRRFFQGVPEHRDNQLDPLLVKYVIHYFDHPFHADAFPEELFGAFWGRDRFRPGPPKAALEMTEACRLLGISCEDFERMNVRELVRCYRTRVMTVHPDKGGDHEEFIHATAAYECLLEWKRRRRFSRSPGR